MSAAKSKKHRQAVERRRRALKALDKFDPDYLALPDEETRQLTLLITTRDGVEPFMRRMVVLLDGLKVGHTVKVMPFARLRKNPEFALLMAAMKNAVGEGRVYAARNTAFYAASYAYQNSLDYVCELMSYLDRLRKVHDR